MISFRIDWFDLLAVQENFKTLLQHHNLKASFFGTQLSLGSTFTSIRDYWKNHSFDYIDLCQQVMSLLFNVPSRFVIAFQEQVSSNFMAAVTVHSDLGAQEIKSITASTFSPSICHEVMGLDTMILVFLLLSFKLAFSLSSFTLIKRLFSSCLLSAISVVSAAFLRLLIFILVKNVYLNLVMKKQSNKSRLWDIL